MINTVSENCKVFKQRKYEEDWEALQSMHLLGFPSESNFGIMVRSKIILNFPVIFEDVKIAKFVFGPSVI